MKNTRKLTAQERKELPGQSIVKTFSATQALYSGTLVRENENYAFYENATFADNGYFKTNAWVVLQKPTETLGGIIVSNGFHKTIPQDVHERYGR